MALAAAASPLARASGHTDGALNFGLTPVFLDHRASLLRQWRRYLEQHLDRPVRFTQRGSYHEIVELLRDGELDLAWLCGYPYVRESDWLRLLAAPLYQGEPLYRSCLIVPHTDRDSGSIMDLEGRLFAYSDPDSLSGYHLPRHAIRGAGADPDAFFARTILSWTHRNAIQAVADRLVDGAAVDGYVLDMVAVNEPHVAARTRVVSRSQRYGFPPIVARGDLPTSSARACRAVLLGMAGDEAGQRILDTLGLDGFARVEPDLYTSIREIADAVDR